MPFDSRTDHEKVFAKITVEKDHARVFTVSVNGNRQIDGLSEAQCEAVVVALRSAMHSTVDRTLARARAALGLT